MLERDVRRLHMETIIQLPMQLLMYVQFGSYSNLACIAQTSVTALGVGLWFPYATGGRRVPALILT